MGSRVMSSMDMQVDREQVRVAEYHLMLVNRVIERQSRLVADLEREGRDAAEARDLLEQCHLAQQSYLANRDRLRGCR
jgi:hypothetical protein